MDVYPIKSYKKPHTYLYAYKTTAPETLEVKFRLTANWVTGLILFAINAYAPQ